MKKETAIKIICTLLVFLFAYAAVSKLFDNTQFKVQLTHSPVIASYAGLMASLLPIIELTIAVMLTVKNIRLHGLYASLCLLSLFTFYIAGMLLSGIHLPCSCGGIVQRFSWKQHLVFNLFFIVLSAIGIVLERNRKLKYAV